MNYIKGIFTSENKSKSKKGIGLYDDKTDPKDEDTKWCDGNDILSRKWHKGMVIEYDSDPDCIRKDVKTHIHIANVINIDRTKQSIAIKDRDGGYITYAVNTIRVKLPPATKENTIPESEQVKSATHDKGFEYNPGLSGNSTTKNAGKPPDKGFERIDFGLNLYYESMGKKDYKNKDGIGKFMEYIEENGVNEEDIKEELNGAVSDCIFTDFDKAFPLKGTDESDRDQKVFEIIQYCHKHGYPNLPQYKSKQTNNDYYHHGAYYHSHGHHNESHQNKQHYSHHHSGGDYYGYNRHNKWNTREVIKEYIVPPEKENMMKEIVSTISSFDDKKEDEEDSIKDEWDENEPDPPLYEWDKENASDLEYEGFERIDHGLQIYYEKLGHKNYINDEGMGKFLEFTEENGLDEDDIEEELGAGPKDCTYIDFLGEEEEDKMKFPLSIKIDDIKELNLKIYKLIKYCHEHAHPPKSHVRGADIAVVSGYIQRREQEFDILIPNVILDVIRKFYPSANFFFSFEEDWSLTITKEDIAETHALVKKQVGGMGYFTDDWTEITPVIAIGRKNGNFPLMQYMFDAYIRDKVNVFVKFGYDNRLFSMQHEKWLTKFPFSDRLQGKDPDTFTYFNKGLKLYNFAKLFPCIVPMSLSIKDRKQIKDDLYKVFYYESGVIQFVNKKTTGRITPFQFDFTLIVYKIFQNDGKYVDHNTQVLTLRKDEVGNIEDNLKLNGCCYVKQEFKSDDIKNSTFVLQKLNDLYNEYVAKKGLIVKLSENDDYPKGKRLCLTIDRRKTHFVDGDLWFLYEPKIKKRLSEKERICWILPIKKYKYLIPEIYHMNSMQCLIPGKDEKSDIRTRICHGITLSFHCQRINQIKSYLWWDNSFMRFMPNDLLNIVPNWFYDKADDEEYAKNGTFKEDKNIQKEIEEKLIITDLHFKDFLKAWTLDKR